MKNRIKPLCLLWMIFVLVPCSHGLEKLPDTGQTRCYDALGNEMSPCPDPGEPFYGQDAIYATNPPSYTKLKAGGVVLPDTATFADGWIMTRDNVTGLIWEIKSDDPTIHDKSNKFTWCDPANQSNPGTCGSGSDTVSDTAAFIKALNTAGFGGFFDWRIPSIQELGSIVNYAASDPAVNQTYFPLTLPAPYWTSTTSIASPESAWSVNFNDGSDSAHNYKSNFFHVLGVRGGQVAVPEPAGKCGAYIAPDVWKEFDCYNLAAIGKTTGDDPFTPSWRLIGGYWQWGRKGPDPSQWFDINTAHFAHGPTGPGSGDANEDFIPEWDSSDASNGAWSDASKTANDPCPSGYRVPTKSQWEGVLYNNTHSTVGSWSESATNYSAARFLGDKLFLPAAGYRLKYSGALYLRGDHGLYWSSSMATGSDIAGGLSFNSGGAYTRNYYRRDGVSVRCVAE